MIDFPSPYTHENPFPLLERFRDDVTRGFETVFSLAGDFLA